MKWADARATARQKTDVETEETEKTEETEIALLEPGRKCEGRNNANAWLPLSPHSLRYIP